MPGSGLLFASYQADVDRQFLPIQRRLDESDMLNEWTTPIGSAVYAIPPGVCRGRFHRGIVVRMRGVAPGGEPGHGDSVATTEGERMEGMRTGMQR